MDYRSEENELIAMFKALSNPSRLQILQWLKAPEEHFPKQVMADVQEVGVCVSFIQQKVGLSQSTVSLYLAELQKAHLVIATRQGQWTYYRRNEEAIQALAESLKQNI